MCNSAFTSECQRVHRRGHRSAIGIWLDTNFEMKNETIPKRSGKKTEEARAHLLHSCFAARFNQTVCSVNA